MATSFGNQELMDQTILHQIELQLYANGLSNDLVGQLNSRDSELFTALLAGLLILSTDTFTVDRIDSMLAPVLRINSVAFEEVQAELRAAMTRLAEAEAAYQKALLDKALAPETATPLVPVVVAGAALAYPILGATPAEHVERLRVDRATRIRTGVVAGYTARQTPTQIVNALRGTVAASFGDGLFEPIRRSLETIIQTTVSGVTEFVRSEFYRINSDMVPEVEWLSVLDGRTSTDCILRSRKRYTSDTHRPIGHSYPWGAGPGAFHFNCRSSFSGLLRGERPNAPTYAEWLARQRPEVQDKVLGKTRAAKFRAGDLPLSKFANDRGRWLRLDELSGA